MKNDLQFLTYLVYPETEPYSYVFTKDINKVIDLYLNLLKNDYIYTIKFFFYKLTKIFLDVKRVSSTKEITKFIWHLIQLNPTLMVFCASKLL